MGDATVYSIKNEGRRERGRMYVCVVFLSSTLVFLQVQSFDRHQNFLAENFLSIKTWCRSPARPRPKSQDRAKNFLSFKICRQAPAQSGPKVKTERKFSKSQNLLSSSGSGPDGTRRARICPSQDQPSLEICCRAPAQSQSLSNLTRPESRVFLWIRFCF